MMESDEYLKQLIEQKIMNWEDPIEFRKDKKEFLNECITQYGDLRVKEAIDNMYECFFEEEIEIRRDHAKHVITDFREELRNLIWKFAMDEGGDKLHYNEICDDAEIIVKKKYGVE